MQAVDLLKSYESQGNLLALLHLFFTQLQDLRHIGFLSVLQFVKSNIRPVDDKFQPFGRKR